jgi:putative transposase
LRQQQRCLARRQKGSRRREKQKLRVARAHARVRQARQNALHELTTRLTQEFDVIAIEDLNVKALSRGRNARSINDAAFGEIRRQLTYKSEWRHKILIEVDRWYASSKTCSNCRHLLDELRLDVRYWTCPKCRATHDRDVNAARNLLMEGLRQLAGRDDRDLCVDARDACPEEILVQVLAEEARSGQRNQACLEQARLH